MDKSMHLLVNLSEHTPPGAREERDHLIAIVRQIKHIELPRLSSRGSMELMEEHCTRKRDATEGVSS